jgi:hypothetical protein
MNKQKKIAYFGAGSIAEKTLRSGFEKPYIIFDNNKNRHGTENLGVNIISPDLIQNYLDEISKFIITTTSYIEVREQLLKIGIPEDKVFISPVLNSIMFVDRLENFSGEYLFTSGLPSFSDNLSGGGVYRLNISQSDYNVEKITSGNCHGLVFNKEKEKFYYTDNDKGIVVLDKSFNEISTIPTPDGIRPHGISFINENKLAVGCAFDDSVWIFDSNNEIEPKRIGLSEQKERYKSPQHHLNDVWCENGLIYVSMFSFSGSWKRGVFDGVVMLLGDGNDIDSLDQKSYKVLMSELKMPHNPQVHGDRFYVCDSLNGKIIDGGKSVLFKSNGFVRGLLIDQSFLIVGESRNRNFANISSEVLNSCIDTRISIIDTESNAYRSIQLPAGISEIHSIVKI